VKLGHAYDGALVRWRRGALSMTAVVVGLRRDGLVEVVPVVAGKYASSQLWDKGDDVEPVDRAPRLFPPRVPRDLPPTARNGSNRPPWLIRLVQLAVDDRTAGSELRRAALDAADRIGLRVDGRRAQALPSTRGANRG
jgi:hypothetical protein